MSNAADYFRDNDPLAIAHNERELSPTERAVWGTCPTCGARPGQPCDPRQGSQLPAVPSTRGGAHVSRLNAAPIRIQFRPVG